MVKILWADADGLCLFTKRMERSLSAENARLRVLLDTQQRSLEQMVEYNRLLSQRVAAYASEINRLNGVAPEVWLRYVLTHIQEWPVNRVRDLLPWKADLSAQ